MSHRRKPMGGHALALPVALVLGACEVIAGLTGDRALGSLGGVGGKGASAGNGGPGAVGGSSSGQGGDQPMGGSSASGGASGDGGGAGEEGGLGGTTGGQSDGGDSGTTGASGSGGGGSVVPAKSCDETTCNGESACTTLYVPGGEFEMGRSVNGADADPIAGQSDELPEHPVRLSGFWLDKYEVTVGRFRHFVDAYDGTKPVSEAGALPNNRRSGWKPDWDVYLPSDNEELRTSLVAIDAKCNESFRTWTPAAGNSECLPINCIDWYVSFAFCIWDGGRLPTEAEWEYAAAGGAENRLYPWGSEAPTGERAIFECNASGGPSCQPPDIRPVNTTSPLGYGLFGQADLAGSMLERTRDVLDPDFYSLGPATDPNVVNLSLDASFDESPARGGSYRANGSDLRSARRETVFRSSRWDGVGLRCARNE